MRRSLLFAFCLACAKPEAPAPAPAAAVSDATGPHGSGRILGLIRFHGTPPADTERPSKMSFPECSSFGPADSSLKLAADGAVADAFVYVKSGLPPGTYAAPASPVVLDQKGCEFRPRVFGVQVGQPLEIRNSDPFLHNTHAFSTGLSGGFNVPLPKEGAKVTKTFAKAQVPSIIGCDVHGWMRAYAGVVANPFFAVTDAQGRFNIGGLPPGKYELEIWQERLGRQTVAVEVKDGGPATVEVEMKPVG